MLKKLIKNLLVFVCVLSVLASAQIANAGTAVNNYPAPSSLTVASYSEKTAKIKWKLSKNLSDNAGFQVLIYNAENGKYVSLGRTRGNSFVIKSLPENSVRKIAVRTYVKKNGKYYNGKSTKIKIPSPVKSVELKSVKYRSKGKVAVSWSKNKKADGYILQYSTSSKFKKVYTSTLVFNVKDKSSADITGLAKAKYYFRITPYRIINDLKYSAKWSPVLSVSVSKGCTFNEMLSAYETDLSGKSTIYSLTKKGVNIKKYSDTYSRFKAIYDWHKANAQSFASCYYCVINFNKCVDALFGDTKKYDSFIWMADGNFQNRSGARPVHKWTVIFLAGKPYIVDPRMEGYISDSCFGLEKGSATAKRFLFKQWYMSLRPKTVFQQGFAVEYKVL